MRDVVDRTWGGILHSSGCGTDHDAINAVTTRVRWALVIGGSVWLLGAVAYVAALIRQRPEDAGIAFLYNAPIAFLFLVLLTFMALEVIRLGVPTFVREHGAVIALWLAGGVILYLRLISKSIEVSGHMAWLPLLTVQLWVFRFPTWVIVIGAAATASAIYLKFALFRGPSGVPGIIAGAIFALALVALTRARRTAGHH